MATIPANTVALCPRCKALRSFLGVSGGGIQYRCSGCEWLYTFTTVAPTGTSSAAVVTPGSTFAITVASGGASFTTGMLLLYDTAANAEILRVTATGSATSIPVGSGVPTPGQVQSGFAKAHLTAVTFGQLLISPSLSAVGEDAVPAAPGYGF